MAEFELQLKYSTPPMKVGMHFLAVLFPIWGIMLPTLTALFIVLLLRLPATIPILDSLCIILALTGSAATCLALALVCDDDKIRVTKDGLSFPIRFWGSLKFRNHKTWQELTALTLFWTRQQTFNNSDSLRLFFRDGGHAQLGLRHLNVIELEQFFIAFESCATKCERDAELPDFERAIQSKKIGSALNYTELWEKSLSHRFSGATFAPLDPETILQDGDYKVLKQLSFGGFNATYLAKKASGNFVVLKESCFSQSEETQQKATESFRREAVNIGSINNQHIAHLLDYFLENGRHYLVVEHIEGIDLTQLVNRSGKQTAETVIVFARQIASALAYLHGQSPPVVHRNVNPDNIVVKNDGTLVLRDFGVANEIVESFTGTLIGTQAYIAPEQFKGKATPLSDVYGLGTTLYLLLTAVQPEPLEQTSMPAGEGSIDLLRELIYDCTNQDESLRSSSQDILARLNTFDLITVQIAELSTVSAPPPNDNEDSAL